MLESGPHFDASKLKPFSLSDFAPKAPSKSSSSISKDAVDQVFDLPARYWNTPSLRLSEAEMDAVQVCGDCRLMPVGWRVDVGLVASPAQVTLVAAI